jgi:DNA invertase Pin-like site-specific DNA recombinase
MSTPNHDSLVAKRCAIYTRKSVQRGLEQDFNTLEAQRAICSAYTSSQVHKGWKELAKHYDDGGESGSTLARPKLQELLGDIENGLVDVVLVYKIDRLTRTLLDFVRLADFFERYGVVFVSITQNFDTADSMGRLVLNILLTFAQFEREMLSDRLRDRVRACKQSGRWAGGPAPYGYDLSRRRLHVNPEEADRVKWVFGRYLEVQNLTQVFREARESGMRSKRWRTRAGHFTGGGPLTKSLINHILGNPIYVGDIRHRDETYLGLHAPIVERGIYDQVHAIRAAQAIKKAGRNAGHILTDLLFDCFGRPMSVKETFVEGRSLKPSRTYVSCQSAWGKRQGLKRLRAPADETEELVTVALSAFLSDSRRVRSMLLSTGQHGDTFDKLSARSNAAGKRLVGLPRDRLRLILRALIERIELSLERVKIVVRCSEMERFIEWNGVGLFKACLDNWPRSRTELIDLPASAMRYDRQLLMPIEPRAGSSRLASPSAGLRALVFEARKLQAMVDERRDCSLAELAGVSRLAPWRFARVLRLNYLAPDIIASILDGTQPAGLTRQKLVKAHLPMDWELQRKLLGFAARRPLEGGE